MSDLNDGTTDKLALDAWDKHEKIAMHFNDLILKVRTQALGALAALITIGGALIHDKGAETAIPWELLTVFFGVLVAFWVAIWILDFKYYNRLLLGAVDALLKLEDQMKAGERIDIEMSHKIEDAALGNRLTHVQKGTINGPTLFYSIVLAVLVFGLLVSGYKSICTG